MPSPFKFMASSNKGLSAITLTRVSERVNGSKEEAKPLLRVFWTLLFLIFTFGISLSAQDRAAINGVVTDSSGAVILNATIELDSSATGFHRSATSGMNGHYELCSAYTVGVPYDQVFERGFRSRN